MSELPIRMARARLLFLLLSLGVSLASSASRHPALAPCLRCRGGAAGIAKPDMPVVAAARKLCTSSGLIASSGSAGISLSNHVRGIVFGGMDGILTTFALLAAAAGTKTSHSLTLVISISTVLADALSMAAGEYLSAKAEEELQGAAFKRPLDDPHPLEKGAAMFIAFTLFGSMPLLGFVITAMLAKGSEYSFQLSVLITAVTLFTLGTIKTTFGVGVWWRSGMEVTVIGGAAACVAYFTAQVVEKLTGLS